MAGISALLGPPRLGSITREIGDADQVRDGSAWRIWPGDIPKTLQWLPTTEIDVTDIDDELCPHALIDRSNGLQVRVINANENWPAAAVRRYLRHG
jgi:hypothetical protein